MATDDLPAEGRVILRPDPYSDGGYDIERPADEPLTGDEARHFARWDGLSRRELCRLLRVAEWERARLARENAGLRRDLRGQPPLALVYETAARLRRVRDLAEVPGRRTIPRGELLAALNAPITDTTETPEEGTTR